MRSNFSLTLISTAVTAFAAGPAPDPTVVAEAEKKFAAAGFERGIRESFLQFFADDSIVFAPEPTNGKAFYTKFTDKGRVLLWRPIFATIARFGEMGFTTGPWEVKNSKTDPTVLGYGDFVSVWKKQTDGSWKVALDVGVDHPQPAGSLPSIKLSPPSGAAGDEANLQKKEEALFTGLQNNGGSALLNAGSDDLRILRDDALPAVGRDAAKSLLNADPVKPARKPTGGGISESHDLAYRYGSYSVEGKPSVAGYYLTYWQTDAKGDWKVILDLQKKAPSK